MQVGDGAFEWWDWQAEPSRIDEEQRDTAYEGHAASADIEDERSIIEELAHKVIVKKNYIWAKHDKNLKRQHHHAAATDHKVVTATKRELAIVQNEHNKRIVAVDAWDR